MKSVGKLHRGGSEVGDNIGHRLVGFLGLGRLNPVDGFDSHFGRFGRISMLLNVKENLFTATQIGRFIGRC
jgi:hypothetical protein